jgi:chemotaxis protein methyltransferase CheR
MGPARRLSEAQVDEVAGLVRSVTGLVFPSLRRGALAEGVHRTMASRGLRDFDRFVRRLSRDTGLLDALVDEVTVGETYFFRSPEQFAQVRERMLPAILREAGRRTLRFWSAGCATGEEAYSLAILALEAGLAGRTAILGTDLSRRALERARVGTYSSWSLRGLPPEAVHRYFRSEGTRYVLDEPIRRAVTFAYLNLVEDSYPSLASGAWAMDLIFCRNVFIYFDRDSVARVASRLLAALTPGGWLVLGPADPLLTVVVPCECVPLEQGLAYRRAPVSDRSSPAGVVSPLPASAPPPAPAAPPAAAPRRVPVPEAEAPPAPAGPTAAERYAAGDYPGAVAEGRRALTHDDQVATWVLVIRALANQGLLDEAGRVLALALDRHRTSAELQYLQATLLSVAGRPAAAAEAARRALYLDPGLVVAHLALGSALDQLGDGAGAVRCWRNAHRLLVPMAPAEPVPAADGETVAGLRRIVETQLHLAGERAA